MQVLPIYLYDNTIDALLDLDAETKGVNRVMYQRDLKIQKGVKNQIRVQFKNSDQKRVGISNTQTFVFSLIDVLSQRQVLKKTLSVIETNTATRGLALLTLTEGETLSLDKSSYKFNIKLQDTDGTYLQTYTDTYYGVAGTAYVLTDIEPVFQPSVEVKDFQVSFNGNTNLYEHKSGSVYANPEYNNGTRFQTIAMYFTNYSGTVYIQGTLANTPGSFGKYANITTRTFNGFTGINYLNFQGVFSYIRVIHIPATAPAESTNDNPTYYGSFDKFLYRS